MKKIILAATSLLAFAAFNAYAVDAETAASPSETPANSMSSEVPSASPTGMSPAPITDAPAAGANSAGSDSGAMMAAPPAGTSSDPSKQ